MSATSSIDSDETKLMLDDSEFAWKSASTSQDETVLSRNLMRSPVTWAALGFVFSSIIYLVVGVALLRSIQRPQSLPAPTETATATIIRNSQEFWPEIPITTRVFVDDDAWKDTGAAGDYLWLHEVVTPGGGYVAVPYPRRYDLAPSAPFIGSKNEAEVYATAAVHQLHCLAALRDIIISYQDNRPARYPGDHSFHCLNYLRQAVLCAGDTTLEYGHKFWSNEKNETEWDFTGTGSVHQCRDWNTIEEFMLKHSASNQTGIQ
ncbi:Tat pathway signal sequence protein [Rutstroemia sp. NJR-2017a WRK4]|nr:Tat pathway signal sequence protein [Rutstroemia sp. NJR-2017a WRK4]